MCKISLCAIRTCVDLKDNVRIASRYQCCMLKGAKGQKRFYELIVVFVHFI